MAGNFAAGSFDLDKFLEKHKLEDIIDLTGIEDINIKEIPKTLKKIPELLSVDKLQELLTLAGRQGLFDGLKPSKTLMQKLRWMKVNVVNESQFHLRFRDCMFECGRFWDAPKSAEVTNHSTFSICEKFGKVVSGVKGALLYTLEVPGDDVHICVAFQNPFIGKFKLRAEFSKNMGAVIKNLNDNTTFTVRKEMGIRLAESEDKIRKSIGENDEASEDQNNPLEEKAQCHDIVKSDEKLLALDPVKVKAPVVTEKGAKEVVRMQFQLTAAPGSIGQVTLTQMEELRGYITPSLYRNNED